MISFTEYLNEAYSSEMKKCFTNSQLQKIGNLCNKHFDISVQDSDFQHYKINKFKMKIGAGSKYVIFLMKDGTFAILHFQNQKTYRMVYAENEDYRTAKDILANSTDVFVFESRIGNADVRFSRSLNKDITDPLQKRAKKVEKRNKIQNDYFHSINNQLKAFGIRFDKLYRVINPSGTYTLMGNLINVNLNNHFSFHADFFNTKKINLTMYGGTAEYYSVDDIDKEIEQLKECRKVFEIVEKIDYDKLPTITRDEYKNYGW